MKVKNKMKKLIKKLLEKSTLKKMNIITSCPRIKGVTEEKRTKQVIISLTSFPARIDSVYKTIVTLLNQKYLPDRVILWLAKEQFPKGIEDIPSKILMLQQHGLEIKWFYDIKAYKKLIPALLEFPDDIIITVDDDWYYSTLLVEILMEEHEKYPDEIICHAATHPVIDENGYLKSSGENIDYRGTTSYFNKLLGGSGVLFPPHSLDKEVLNENVFMNIAPTNDDIWFWAMAVKKGTKTRIAKRAIGLLLMTDPENQNKSALGFTNCLGNTYEKVTENIFTLYPEVQNKLKEEVSKDLKRVEKNNNR